MFVSDYSSRHAVALAKVAGDLYQSLAPPHNQSIAVVELQLLNGLARRGCQFPHHPFPQQPLPLFTKQTPSPSPSTYLPRPRSWLEGTHRVNQINHPLHIQYNHHDSAATTPKGRRHVALRQPAQPKSRCLSYRVRRTSCL